ncbi:MAG: hypothetical protein WAV48_04555 [Candidatus Magasanikiibacteriota bacterium]
MKVIELEVKELRSIGNFEHRAFGLKIALDRGESVAETLEAMDAFVKLEVDNSIRTRVKQARRNLETITDHEDFNYTEALRVLEQYEPLIKLAEKVGYKP